MDHRRSSGNALAMGKRLIWIRLAAVSLSGLLVAGLFPPWNFSALVWVALIPLLAVLWSLPPQRAARYGFMWGYLAGLVSCAIQFQWLAVVASAAAVLMPAYLALYWGAFGAFAATIGNPWRAPAASDTQGKVLHSLRISICTAAVWAGLEWLRSWLLTGFGWNPLGVAFHQTPVMAQAADLLGVVGLSMLPVFLQAVLLQTARRSLDSAKSDKRQTRIDFRIAVLVVGLCIGYGMIRIRLEGQGPSIRLKALLVQLNIPQDAAQKLWEPAQVHMAYEEDTLDALKQIANDSANDWPDWVMWPESALSGSILTAEDGTWGEWIENMETIRRVRAGGPFQLIYGVTEFEAEKNANGELLMKDRGKAWNSLAVMDPQNDLQTYRKHHLVLFGETIPLVDQIPLIKELYQAASGVEYGGSFTAGTSFDPLTIPNADGKSISAIPSVCFEDSVPRLTRHFLRPSPQVIVNVTNDGWFKQSAAATQHFANARFRAIEFRRPMIRCANNGVSAAVDTTGSTAHPETGKPQILADANGSSFTRGSLLTQLNVPLQPSFSLYAIIGDWGVICISMIALVVSFVRRPRSDRELQLAP